MRKCKYYKQPCNHCGNCKHKGSDESLFNGTHRKFYRENELIKFSNGKYKVEVVIYKKNRDYIKYSYEGNDVAYLKKCAFDSIVPVCKAHEVEVGELYIEMEITENGEYFDRDEIEVLYNGEKIEIKE